MKIKYDKNADAMYIYLRKGRIEKTIKVNNQLLIDVDKKGNVIGIEILDVFHQIPKKEIGKVYSEIPVYI
ncbi:MAG: DUF2283 domain-containing protein [Patescibacteria group bacterium]|nr:DUF2283 domain-containing protein [Patescibacteria group bacterium]